MKDRQKSSKTTLLALFIAGFAAFLWLQSSDGSTASNTRSTVARVSSGVSIGLETPRMMELFAPYCPSCREMDPLVTKLKEKCHNKGVQVVQVDISQTGNERFVDEYDIDAVPTFIFIDDSGQETGRLVGKQPETTLKDHLSSIAGPECAS
jgi:thiol-disulfide isomerase/thioredoxin